MAAEPGNPGGNKPADGPKPAGQPSPAPAPAPIPAKTPALGPSGAHAPEKHLTGRIVDPPRAGDRFAGMNPPPKRASGCITFLLIAAILAIGGYWLWHQGRLDPLFAMIDPYAAPVAEKMRPFIDKIESLIPGHQAPAAEDQAAMVEEIKKLLVKLDFQPGPIDGTLDPATVAAIESYQQTAGLPVDGQPSEALLEDLRAVASQTPISN